MNDLFLLDVSTRTWSQVRTLGQAPQARAGMSLSWVHGMLYLFGGSGHTTRCFNDVHIFDPTTCAWMEGHPTDSQTSYAPALGGGSRVVNSPSSCVPERRAGHAAVVVGRKLFVFGGACGTKYYGKGRCFILDTDAAPQTQSDATPMVSHAVRAQLATYFDSPQFSDVQFVFPVTGQRLYAHKILLSVFSDHFRSMFGREWKESSQNEIMLPEDIGYDVFRSILNFIYTGEVGGSVLCHLECVLLLIVMWHDFQ